MPRLSTTERERAIGMLQGRSSVAEVARRLNCTRNTVYRLRDRLQQTGSTSDRPRSGQPSVTIPKQDAYIRGRHMQNRSQTASSTARRVVGLRGKVCRRLRAASRPSCTTPLRWPRSDRPAQAASFAVGSSAKEVGETPVERCSFLG